VVAKAKTALDAGAAMTATTKSEDRVPGVLSHHVYTVDKVEDGFVYLRNPFAMYEPLGNGKDDGSFKLSLADFRAGFTGIDWV
jgi:hypothetical protein